MPPENERLEVTVRNREEIVFQGEVTSMTSYNRVGQFDILPAHANFISLISERVDLRLPDGQLKTIDVGNGVVRVVRNKVNVLVGIKHEGAQAQVPRPETIS